MHDTARVLGPSLQSKWDSHSKGLISSNAKKKDKGVLRKAIAALHHRSAVECEYCGSFTLTVSTSVASRTIESG